MAPAHLVGCGGSPLCTWMRSPQHAPGSWPAQACMACSRIASCPAQSSSCPCHPCISSQRGQNMSYCTKKAWSCAHTPPVQNGTQIYQLSYPYACMSCIQQNEEKKAFPVMPVCWKGQRNVSAHNGKCGVATEVPTRSVHRIRARSLFFSPLLACLLPSKIEPKVAHWMHRLNPSSHRC